MQTRLISVTVTEMDLKTLQKCIIRLSKILAYGNKISSYQTSSPVWVYRQSRFKRTVTACNVKSLKMYCLTKYDFFTSLVNSPSMTITIIQQKLVLQTLCKQVCRQRHCVLLFDQTNYMDYGLEYAVKNDSVALGVVCAKLFHRNNNN